MKISAMFPKKMPILVELQDMPEVEPITHTRRAHTHTPTCDGIVEFILIAHLPESKPTTRSGQMYNF